MRLGLFLTLFLAVILEVKLGHLFSDPSGVTRVRPDFARLGALSTSKFEYHATPQ